MAGTLLICMISDFGDGSGTNTQQRRQDGSLTGLNACRCRVPTPTYCCSNCTDHDESECLQFFSGQEGEQQGSACMALDIGYQKP